MKRLLLLMMVPFVFACSKDDGRAEAKTSVRVSTYRMSGADSVPQPSDIYLFKGKVDISGGVDLIEKGLSSYKSEPNTSTLQADVEPGSYTVAVQLPIYLSQGPGTYSFKTFEIKEGQSLTLIKTFTQYTGSYTLDPWK